MAGMALVAALLGTTAEAHHADVTRSDPPNGARLAARPAAVRAWFNQPLVIPGSGFTVTDESGRRLDDGVQTLDPADARQLSVQLVGGGQGTYTVTWRVMAESDFDYAQGTFSFVVEGPGPLERATREGLLALGIGLVSLGAVRLSGAGLGQP
jgi:hypothetical protein